MITTAQNALIIRWLQETSGITSVVPKTLQTPAQVAPYVLFSLHDVKGRGSVNARSQEWRGSPGSEIVVHQHLVHEVTISIQLVPSLGAPPGDGTERLHTAVERLSLDSWSNAFKSVGLSLITDEPVLDVPILTETMWSQRATVDLRFQMMSDMSEATTYIETVEVSPHYE
jgi:hypothetical protein